MARTRLRQSTSSRVAPATLPTPAQLATLGTVLCLYRPGFAGELGGWTSAVHAEVHSGLDDEGLQESLWCFDTDGRCCWRLYLLPDSDFLGWSRVAATLPNVCADVVADGIAERLWQGLSRRLRGEIWQASVLRFHALRPAPVADDPVPMLVASLAAVSPIGADAARRIARAHGGEAGVAIDNCCCQRAAFASRADSRERARDADAPHSR